MITITITIHEVLPNQMSMTCVSPASPEATDMETEVARDIINGLNGIAQENSHGGPVLHIDRTKSHTN